MGISRKVNIHHDFVFRTPDVDTNNNTAFFPSVTDTLRSEKIWPQARSGRGPIICSCTRYRPSVWLKIGKKRDFILGHLGLVLVIERHPFPVFFKTTRSYYSTEKCPFPYKYTPKNQIQPGSKNIKTNVLTWPLSPRCCYHNNVRTLTAAAEYHSPKNADKVAHRDESGKRASVLLLLLYLLLVFSCVVRYVLFVPVFLCRHSHTMRPNRFHVVVFTCASRQTSKSDIEQQEQYFLYLSLFFHNNIGMIKKQRQQQQPAGYFVTLSIVRMFANNSPMIAAQQQQQ